jgi:Carboxylesterase family
LIKAHLYISAYRLIEKEKCFSGDYRISKYLSTLKINVTAVKLNIKFPQNPVPAEPWSGTLDARTEKSICMQKNYLIPNPPLMGEEDCLYLYVYRPAKVSCQPSFSLTRNS